MNRRLKLDFKRLSKTFVCSIVFAIIFCSAFCAKADSGFYAGNDSQIYKNRLFYIDVCYDSSYGVSSAIINIKFDSDMAVFKSLNNESGETALKARENGGTISIIYADCSEDKSDQRLFTMCLKSLKEGNFDINISCEELMEKNSSDYVISKMDDRSLCNVTVNEKSVSVKTTDPVHSSKNKASDKKQNNKNSEYNADFIDDYNDIEEDGETDKINIIGKNNDIVRFTVIIVIVVFIGFVVFYLIIERKLKKIKNKDKKKEEENKDKEDKDKEKADDDNKDENNKK